MERFENVNETTYETRYRPFLENFEKLWKIGPQHPKLIFYRIFNKEILAKCVALWVKKAYFVLLGPPPLWIGPPKNISGVDLCKT